MYFWTMTLTINQFDNNVLTEEDLILKTNLPFVVSKTWKTNLWGEKFAPWQNKEESEQTWMKDFVLSISEKSCFHL